MEMIPMYVYKMYLFLFELLYHCFSSTASFNLKVNKTKVITTANQSEGKACDAEMCLVQEAFDYNTEGVYPPRATNNEKRSIRRKAEKCQHATKKC